MNAMLRFATRWVLLKDYHTIAILVGTAMTGAVIVFPASLLSNTNVLLGFCLIPFGIFISGKQKFNYTYLVLTIVFEIAAYAYGVRAFYFFMLAFYFLFLFELYFGKINPLILFLVGLMSPISHQVSVILGFPIRLQLSQWAGTMLSAAGINTHVEGNVMTMKGNLFTVDDACMGLSMLSTSLLMGVAVIAHQYRVSGSRLNIVQLTSFFAMVFVLNIISNLFRIVLLVLFQVLPENPMHDVIGILCLILYVVVPLYFIGLYSITKWGKPSVILQETKPITRFHKVLLGALALLITVTGIHIHFKRSAPHQLAHARVELPHVRVVKMDEGITKLYNDKILVYVKPIPEFFTGEHTPLLCWKGSGYKFQSLKKTVVGGNEIYVGLLEKPGEKLFTAWWYNNGEILTINQWEWRTRMLKGQEKFSLINVTAKSEKALMENLQLIFENNWLNVKNESNSRNL